MKKGHQAPLYGYLCASAVMTTIVGLGQQGAALAQELLRPLAEKAGDLAEGLDKTLPCRPAPAGPAPAEVLVVSGGSSRVLGRRQYDVGVEMGILGRNSRPTMASSSR